MAVTASQEMNDWAYSKNLDPEQEFPVKVSKMKSPGSSLPPRKGLIICNKFSIQEYCYMSPQRSQLSLMPIVLATGALQKTHSPP